MSEINIVPLVDVVLVLLIIFMLTAHVMEFGLEIDVPKVKQLDAFGEGTAGAQHFATGRYEAQRQAARPTSL